MSDPKFRTDGAWGTGLGHNLSPSDIDGNFYALLERIVALESGVTASIVSISSITQTGSALTVHLSNGDVFGPYPLPAVRLAWRGLWEPAAAYLKNDIVRVPGQGVYVVLNDHTAPAIFSAGSDYQLMLVDTTSRWDMVVAASDESTALVAATGLVTFRVPSPVRLSEIRATLNVAQATGSILTIDVKRNGVSMLSTLITIDNTERTSRSAAVPAVLLATNLDVDDDVRVDVTQIGDGTAKGLKIALLGTLLG